MGWCAWYLLTPFGHGAFAFSGLLSCNHLCLNGESLFSCFNEFLSRSIKTSQKLFSKDLPCISWWLQQDLQPCLQGKIWDKFFAVLLYHTCIQDSGWFGEQKQGTISLKVEKYSSAWIPVQGLEEGFKDEISWCLYVISTPPQETAQRGSIEGETGSASSFHENLVKENCFCSAASPLNTVRELSTAPTWMQPLFMNVACQSRQMEVTSQWRKLLDYVLGSPTEESFDTCVTTAL